MQFWYYVSFPTARSVAGNFQKRILPHPFGLSNWSQMSKKSFFNTQQEESKWMDYVIERTLVPINFFE